MRRLCVPVCSNVSCAKLLKGFRLNLSQRLYNKRCYIVTVANEVYDSDVINASLREMVINIDFEVSGLRR
jgi:hypothetical protein